MTDTCKRGNLPLVVTWLVFLAGSVAAAADAPRTGDFELAFTENSPLTAWREASTRFLTDGDPQLPEPGGKRAYALADEPFAMHVPKDYDGTRPCGLIAFAYPGPGGAPSAEFAEVCDRHHVIWMGATRFSGERATIDKGRILVDGVFNVVKRYRIDPERICIADYRGSGSLTRGVGSMIAMGYPEVFTGGALYLHGVFQDSAMVRSGAVSERLLIIARMRRYAFVADPAEPHRFCPKSVADTCELYRKDGYTHVKLIDQPGLDASNIPSKASFEAAIDFIDEPLVDRARQAIAAGQKSEAAKKYREALVSYAGAAECVADQAVVDAASARRQEVIAILDADAAKELAPLLAKPQAVGLRAFVLKWPAALPSVATARAAVEPLGAAEWATLEPTKPTELAMRAFIKTWSGYDASKPAVTALEVFAQQAWDAFAKLKPGAPRTKALARFPDQWDGTPTGAHAREVLGKEVVDEIDEIRQLPEEVQIARLRALYADLRGSRLGKDIDARLDELDKTQQAKAKAKAKAGK